MLAAYTLTISSAVIWTVVKFIGIVVAATVVGAIARKLYGAFGTKYNTVSDTLADIQSKLDVIMSSPTLHIPDQINSEALKVNTDCGIIGTAVISVKGIEALIRANCVPLQLKVDPDDLVHRKKYLVYNVSDGHLVPRLVGIFPYDKKCSITEKLNFEIDVGEVIFYVADCESYHNGEEDGELEDFVFYGVNENERHYLFIPGDEETASFPESSIVREKLNAEHSN